MKEIILFAVFLIMQFLQECNAQTINVTICFFSEDSIELSNVELEIECQYCDSMIKMDTDTSNCVSFSFECDKVYLLRAYHDGFYSIKGFFETPCLLENRKFFLKKMVIKGDGL